jgi:phosphatidylserine decarboxylase
MKIAHGSLFLILFTFCFGLILLFFSFFFKNSVNIVLLFISLIGFLLSGFLLIFFRDPDRNIGEGIVACADGKIREISEIYDKEIGKCYKISTFMNIYNVHVNRMPITGTIKKITHYKGFHLPAFKKESEKNERVILITDSDIGKIKIIQIAGTLARRITSYIKENEKIMKGDKIGIIKFGSRVDVYLPVIKIKKVNVKVKDIVKAGEDTIAEVNA